jgi:hypothetical protein
MNIAAISPARKQTVASFLWAKRYAVRCLSGVSENSASIAINTAGHIDRHDLDRRLYGLLKGLSNHPFDRPRQASAK